MDVLDIVIECVPYVLSILATIFAFKKGKSPKAAKTVEQLEAAAELKKQKYLSKLVKKNKIVLKDETVSDNPSDNITIL